VAVLQFFPTFMPRFIRKPMPKTIFCLRWNWTAAKNCFLPRLKIEPRPKGSLGFKNRKSLFFFFFLGARSLSQPPTSTATVALRPLATTWRLAHSCSGLAKCDLRLTKWASFCCVADAWMEICRWWWRYV